MNDEDFWPRDLPPIYVDNSPLYHPVGFVPMYKPRYRVKAPTRRV